LGKKREKVQRVPAKTMEKGSYLRTVRQGKLSFLGKGKREINLKIGERSPGTYLTKREAGKTQETWEEKL